MRHKLRRRYGRSEGSSIQFRDLNVGDEFDFVSPNPMMNSFYETCTKTGPRTYTWVSQHPVDRGRVFKTRVGSINVKVYHVDRKGGR